MARFIVDTSVLTQAHRLYYPRDVVPGFWRTLQEAHARGDLTFIDRVLKEINDYHEEDELSEWANHLIPSSAFPSTATAEVTGEYGRLVAWVEAQARLSRAAKDRFARGADGWVIAYAIVEGCTVISQEERSPNSKSNIKIPDVCDAHSVKHLGTIDLLRALGAKFD